MSVKTQMAPTRLLRSLNAALKVNAVLATRAVIAADHEGYHHSAYDWWIYRARMTSPKTCEVCKVLDLRDFRGDWIPHRFRYHIHKRINQIKPMTHRHCYCTLWWAGRSERVHSSPFGLLTPEEVSRIWQPTTKELENLTPSQLEYIFKFLRSPYAG